MATKNPTGEGRAGLDSAMAGLVRGSPAHGTSPVDLELPARKPGQTVRDIAAARRAMAEMQRQLPRRSLCTPLLFDNERETERVLAANEQAALCELTAASERPHVYPAPAPDMPGALVMESLDSTVPESVRLGRFIERLIFQMGQLRVFAVQAAPPVSRERIGRCQAQVAQELAVARHLHARELEREMAAQRADVARKGGQARTQGRADEVADMYRAAGMPARRTAARVSLVEAVAARYGISEHSARTRVAAAEGRPPRKRRAKGSQPNPPRE